VSQVQMQYNFSKFFSMQICSVVVSSKVGREKESRDSLWMPIWGCGSPARYCHPAVAGGFIYADLGCELSTYLAPQALFTLSFPGPDATATSFPLSKHTEGGDTAPAFLGQCVYLQFTWEVGLPPSSVEFSSHCHFYKLSCSWLLGVCCCSWLLWPACEGFPLPLSSVLRVPCPLCYVSFLLLFLIIQFFFLFSLGGVGLSRGLCWSVPGLSVEVPHAA
jgi:hypothetical protein